MIEIIADMLKEHEEDSLIWGATTEEAIAGAENALGVRFPEEYREFVKVFGSGGIGGVEIEGVEGQGASVVNATERYRKLGLAKNIIVVMDSDDFAHCMNTSETNGAVYSMHRTSDGLTEPTLWAKSFYNFVTEEFRDAIRNLDIFSDEDI